MPSVHRSFIALAAVACLACASQPVRANALPESGNVAEPAASPVSSAATRLFPAPRQGEPKWSWMLLGGRDLSACRHDGAGASAATVCGPPVQPAGAAAVHEVHPITRQVTWLWAWVQSDDGRLRVCRAPGVAGLKARPVCSDAVAMNRGGRVRSVRPVDRVGAGQWAWIVDDLGGLRLCRFNSTSESVVAPVCSDSVTGAVAGPIESVHPIVQTGGTQPAWVVYRDGAVGVCRFTPAEVVPAEVSCAPAVMPASGTTTTP